MNDEAELERVKGLVDKRDAGEEPDEVADVAPLQPPTEPSPLDAEMVQMFGMSFLPQPFGYVITRGTFRDQPCLFLTFEHAHGRISFPLSDLEAQGMANRLTQMSGAGLVVARDVPANLKSV